MATLEEAIQGVDASVNDLMRAMMEEGVPEFQINLVDKVLRPLITGIVIAHALQLPTDIVENSIVDTYVSGLVELFKRTHPGARTRKNADAVAIHAQQMVNDLSAQLSAEIQEQFAPKVELVNTRH